MRTWLLVPLGLALLVGPLPSDADTIDWVDFSSYTIGASSQAGFTSSDGL